MRSRDSQKLTLTLMFVGAVVTLCLHASHYYPFIADDALISLRYSDRLVAGSGLTWTEGHPVEGYSNLLWVLLNALLHFFGMDLIDSSRLLGLLATSLAALSLLYYGRLLGDALPRLYASLAVGLFFFCAAAPVAIWAIGGLEQPLFAGLIALSIPLTVLVIETDGARQKTLRRLSLVLGLICLTRPDGPLFALAAVLSILIGRLVSRRPRVALSDFFVVALFPTLFYGGQLVFRLSYYGEWVPNTALVKIAPSQHHLEGGLRYLQEGSQALLPFSVFAIFGAIFALTSRQTRARIVAPLMILVLWVPYVAAIGGDIFPGYRHFVPIIVALMFILVEGTSAALRSFTGKSPVYANSFWGILLASSFVFVTFQFSDDANKRAVSERWEWDGQVIGQVLNQAFSAQQPLVAVTAAGCVPYWSQLPSLDMLGLNDYYLPRHRPAEFGEGVLGHELGDGNYVFSKQPDIVIFHTGERESWFRSARELLSNPEFRRRYTLITVLGKLPHEYQAVVWFDKYSSKIGIAQSAAEIRVPGFLLAGANAIASLNESGRLVLSLPPGQSASIHIDSAPRPEWTVDVGNSHAGITGQIVPMGNSFELRLVSTSQTTVEVEAVIVR